MEDDNGKHKKELRAEVKIDGMKKVLILADLLRENDGETTKISPSLELTIPGMKRVMIHGLFVDKPGELNQGELRIHNISQEPILIKGKCQLIIEILI